jgi:hypothetical protein
MIHGPKDRGAVADDGGDEKLSAECVTEHLMCWKLPIEYGELTFDDGRYYVDGWRINKYNIRTTSIDGGYIRFVRFDDRLVVVRTYKKSKGKRKMLDEQVRGIRLDRDAGMLTQEVANKYGCTPQLVSQIYNRHTYKDVK